MLIKGVGQSTHFYIIKCQLCAQTSEYFMYNAKLSSPYGLCRCVSYRAVLCLIFCLTYTSLIGNIPSM